MASAISRFVIFWIISGGLGADCKSEHHPLCRTLEGEERQHSTHFPSAYTCLGDNADAVCRSRETDARHEEAGAVTWWVYPGQRQHSPGSAADEIGHEWIDCTDYYARNSTQSEADVIVRAREGESFSTTTNTFLAPPGISTKPRPGTGNAQIIPVSQDLRTLRRTDALGLELAKDRNPQLELESIRANRQQDSLVHAPHAECDDLWLSWPQMQENAIAAGTVLIYDVITSVGNLFLAFATMIQLARLLELGVILRWTNFPGFRQAFNPGEINWDLDPEPFMQQMGHRTGGANATGLHSMKFNNFALVLSDSQLELLASTLNIREPNMEALAAHVQKELPMVLRSFMSMVMREPIVVNDNVPSTQPCTWNMFLKRSPSMMAGLEQYSPWGMANDGSGHQHHIADYIAWHIRTPDGESARSYSPTIHQYVLQEPSSNVCPTFMVATDDALELAKACDSSLASDVADELVYISSNSKPMTKNCTLNAENHDLVMCHVDLGLDSGDAHTAHSQRPLETALGAFLDFLFLMDSAIIVRTGSSFSGTVVNIKGMNCHHRIYDSLPNRILNICLPPGC